MSGNNSIEYYLSPRRRLDTLFAVHSTFSVLIGAIGFLFPSTASAFFLTENDREFRVARAILRPYCSLVLAQGFIIHRARKINDGEIKRAFVQAYFVCFLLSTMSLINEHSRRCQDIGNDCADCGIWMVYILSASVGIFWIRHSTNALSLSTKRYRKVAK
eukprot:CAMPEP_0178596754 /NCGR_PEP_ID=MMETSP0697-20121206/31811_1 /TAXON_ID=265572 /ORGANISM="Extubocellulus spinifer, Strain CCMP396" /LENGTH=159 /DNA_ID=CAMNT_0020234343 /DNA_START=263 /DNA_END=742 /DNA_ORIENTATION=-